MLLSLPPFLPLEYSLAAPLTTMDLQQVLQQFPDPTQPPDPDDDIAALKPITGGLDVNKPLVVWTVTPSELQPYSITLTDYSPMRIDDSEVHLSCTPGGPHCAELDQLHCAVCRSYCKEPGGPTNHCFCRQEVEAKAAPKYVPLGDETIYNLGAVYLHPGGATPRPHISCIFRKEVEMEDDDKDTSDDKDYDNQDPFPVPTVGSSAMTHAGVDWGWTTNHQKQGT